jgi:hypothetical protein
MAFEGSQLGRSIFLCEVELDLEPATRTICWVSQHSTKLFSTALCYAPHSMEPQHNSESSVAKADVGTDTARLQLAEQY